MDEGREHVQRGTVRVEGGDIEGVVGVTTISDHFECEVAVARPEPDTVHTGGVLTRVDS